MPFPYVPKHFNGKNIAEGVFFPTQVNPVRGVELDDTSKLNKNFKNIKNEYTREGYVSRPVPPSGDTNRLPSSSSFKRKDESSTSNLSDVELVSSSGSRSISHADSASLIDNDLEHDMNNEEPEASQLLYSFDDNYNDEEIE